MDKYLYLINNMSYMTQVSQRFLDPAILTKLFLLFFEAVGHHSNSEEFENITKDLLSPAEKIMLAKRVAIIYLLLKKKDVLTISQALKVSTSTVSKFKYIIDNSQGIVLRFNKIINREKVKDILSDLFRDFFFPTFKYGSNWSENLRNRRRIDKEREQGI